MSEWNSNLILPGGAGNPRQQVADIARRQAEQKRNPESLTHGMTTHQIVDLNKRFDSMMPRLASADPNSGRKDLFSEALPTGASWDPRTGGRRQAGGFMTGGGGSGLGSSSGGGNMSTMQRPYQPEFASSDRQQYPVHRILANRYWRLFIKMDPVLGTGLDMYGEMPWGECRLTGEGVEGSVREAYEAMWEGCNISSLLPAMVKEFLGIGEVVPHAFFDDNEGIWTYVALHNPDNLEVVDAPFIKMEPLMEFVPDDKLRQILTSTDPELQKVKSQLPAELLAKLYSRQNIRLSDVNATFIPRKLHHYETRGTSILSRMWRIFMYEDAIFEASLATARRHAGPLKIAKLGNPQTNWIPGPDQERRFAELVAQAEIDPHCFVPSTPVVMSDGSARCIADLRLGDRLLDMHGQECEVLALQEEYSDKLIRIEVQGADSVDCTPQHKWPVYQGEFGGGGKVVTLRAEEMQRGDFLMIPRTFKEVRPADVTPEMARLLGYYASEGNAFDVYTREDGSVQKGFELSFCDDEADTIAKDAADIITMMTGHVEFVPGEQHNIQVRSRCNAGSDLAKWLAHHAGQGAKTKRLSADVMAWPLDLKWEFLKGYVAGDGSSIVQRNDTRLVEIGSASETLINQVSLLLIQMGARASKSYRKQPAGSFGAGNDFWRLHLYGAMAARLSKECWGIETRIPRLRQCWWADETYVYVKVKSVRTVEKASPVINMTVSGDHTYLVEGGLSTRNSWIIYHYGLSLEAFGTTDRVMTINKEWEIIERIKLAALGLSRSFLTGELTFASATAGLQVFLRRLLSMRNFFTSTWIKPKFFKPVAIMNNFIKPTQAELSNRIRVRRTAENLIRDKRLIIPQLDWANKLNPMVDNDLIKAYESLEKMGFRISKTKKGAAVNLGYEEEVRRCIEEDKFEDAVREEHGLPKEKGDPDEIKQVIDKTDESNPDKGKPPAGTPPPNPRMPPPSPAAPPEEPKKDDKKGEVEETSDDEELAQPAKPGPGPEGWSDGEVSGLIELLAQGTTDQAFWAQLIPRRVKKLETDPQTHTQHHVEVLEGPDPHRHMRRGDPDRAWDEIEMFLDDQGYPAKDIDGLRTYLVRHDVLAPSALERFEASLPADTTTLSDKQMNDLFDTAVASSLRSRKI